jgi:hypothetical protein
MAMKNLLLVLSLTVFAGCTTVKSYTPKTESGPAKPADYPIYVYPEKIGVPRPYEVIGAMSIRDTPFTLFGGSFEGELNTLRKHARKKGADALKLTAVEQPDFLHAKYRMEANFLRFTEAWENIAVSEDELRTYLQDQQSTLDPIEGIWLVNDALRSRVGIMRNKARAGREFVTFMLATTNPTWRPGDKKLDLTRGERPGVYRGVYCFDDYRRKSVAFSLLGSRTNVFILPMPDENPPVIFTKE